MQLKYFTQSTPNPNAKKFIFNKDVKSNGKVTYNSLDECTRNPLAGLVFKLDGVVQVHFFENVITVTQDGSADWTEMETTVIDIVKDNYADHDPDFEVDEEADEDARRAALPEDIQQMEKILDKTIRPGLQRDGGDVIIVEFERELKTVKIKYEGACTTCPSSSMGTLFAIKGVLNDEFDPELDVVAVD